MQYFLPQSRDDILEIDSKMRRKLAGSLDYIFKQTASALGVQGVDLEAAISEILAHRQHPAVFARYFELVFALKAKRHEEAARLIGEIATMSRATPSFETTFLTSETMGDDAARYTRLLNAGEKGPVFAAPAPSDWPLFQARVATALSELNAADASLAAEIRALATQVIGAVPVSPTQSFGSISSLTLWGSVVLNLEIHREILDVIDGIVHESAHLLLFGYAIDEPLVANSDAERFQSPLRSDPRPMDGVFHATFVCARLHYLYRVLLERGSKLLSGAQAGQCERKLELLARKFDDGAQVIADSGRLTPTGEKVMRSTLDYMSRVAA
jgi:HEXXH motif-containing protein